MPPSRAGYLALAPHLTRDDHAVTHMVATTFAAAAREGDLVEVRGTLDAGTKTGSPFVSAVATVAGETVARTATKSIVPWG